MSVPQRAVVLEVIDGVGGEARWPRRPVGTAAFRSARWLLVVAAVGFGPRHPLGHVARDMAAAMKLA